VPRTRTGSSPKSSATRGRRTGWRSPTTRQAKPATNAANGTDLWQIRITAKGWTDVHILENVIAPGGTFGWHSHPGPSLVIVKSGTLSVYHTLDCKPKDFGPLTPNGTAFVDQGHDLHMVRNNSTTDTADVYVVSFVPAGQKMRPGLDLHNGATRMRRCSVMLDPPEALVRLERTQWPNVNPWYARLLVACIRNGVAGALQGLSMAVLGSKHPANGHLVSF
jgi:hypothetical protein